MKGYLNLHQTCEALGVKRTTLYKLIHQGAFHEKSDTIIHCNKRWFSEKAVDKYIQNVIDSNCMAAHHVHKS